MLFFWRERTEVCLVKTMSVKKKGNYAKLFKFEFCFLYEILIARTFSRKTHVYFAIETSLFAFWHLHYAFAFMHFVHSFSI